MIEHEKVPPQEDVPLQDKSVPPSPKVLPPKLMDRPVRTTKMPAKFKDFVLP